MYRKTPVASFLCDLSKPFPDDASTHNEHNMKFVVFVLCYGRKNDDLDSAH